MRNIESWEPQIHNYAVRKKKQKWTPKNSEDGWEIDTQNSDNGRTFISFGHEAFWGSLEEVPKLQGVKTKKRGADENKIWIKLVQINVN